MTSPEQASRQIVPGFSARWAEDHLVVDSASGPRYDGPCPAPDGWLEAVRRNGTLLVLVSSRLGVRPGQGFVAILSAAIGAGNVAAGLVSART